MTKELFQTPDAPLPPTGELAGRRILLGVSGGIAAYKAAELVRLLIKAGAQVQVAMTAAATHFVTPVTFQALSGQPVFVDQWDARVDNNMAHIDLSRQADAILVAPASADLLAKIAQGRADDLLSTLILARNCPLLVAPAMNRQMWENPATRRNATQLAEDGVVLLGPDAGPQACGEVGDGRMWEPEALKEALVGFFQPKRLAGRRVLLTAGPTYEAIDPVRGITNLSSGRMGYALARACQQAGAQVTLVSGPTDLPCPLGVERIGAASAREMREAVLARVGETQVFIAVAAVADYRPEQAAPQKIKKTADSLTLTLVKNPDILAEVAALPAPPFCVGFAAESENLAAYAEAKRQKKRLPLVVGNLFSDAFGGAENKVVLFDADGAHPLAPASKARLATQIVAHLAGLLAAPVRI